MAIASKKKNTKKKVTKATAASEKKSAKKKSAKKAGAKKASAKKASAKKTAKKAGAKKTTKSASAKKSTKKASAKKTAKKAGAKKTAKKAGAKRAGAKIQVGTVNVPGYRSNVNADKYTAMKKALKKVLPRREPGLTQAEMFDAVKPHLPEALFPGGAKAGWWAKTVQLDLETTGEVVRDRAARPTRWRRG